MPVVKTPFKRVERPGKRRLRQLLGPFFPKKKRFFAVLPPQAPPEGTVPAPGRVMKVSAVQVVAGPRTKRRRKKRERAAAAAEVMVAEPLERKRKKHKDRTKCRNRVCARNDFGAEDAAVIGID